ncbi:MAG: hypothetical protein QNJ47_01685 [Nostocaceae cyanobacterium]|nr:hypothetical protein [Nostocaceae cyanobacterium]
MDYSPNTIHILLSIQSNQPITASFVGSLQKYNIPLDFDIYYRL